jgi:plastocyanin
VVWTPIVVLFLVLAAGGPVEMVKARSGGGGGGVPGAGAGGAGGGDGPARVTMAGVQFRPGTLEVRRGTEVVFENDDLAPHTVTAEGGGPVDSGILAPGRGVFRLVVDEPLSYFCQVHPSMKGRIILTG